MHPATPSRHAPVALLRCVVLVAALGAIFVSGGGTPRGVHRNLVNAILALLAVGTVVLATRPERWLPAAMRDRHVAPLSLLALDLLAVGLAGTYLRSPEPPVADVAFLGAYLVGVLVAITGRRAAAAGLGTLAGAMVLLLWQGGSVPEADAGTRAAEARLDLLLALSVTLIGAGTSLTAVLTGWVDGEVRKRVTAQAVERELRTRESIATEMAVFSHDARAVGSLSELAEAILLHVRLHFPTAVRAVALEDAGDRVAVWEDAGATDEGGAEERRRRLEQALREAGSTSLVPRVQVRSGTGTRATDPRLRTTIAIPVHATGRVGGVVFVGDPRRDAVPPERLGALAELGRQAGDALRRLERSRDEQTRRTSLLLSHMREGVVLLGSDGGVLLSNPAGTRVLEALGHRPDGTVSFGDASAHDLAAIAAGSVRRWSIGVKSPDGRSLLFSAVAVAVVDGGARLGTLVTISDVTDEDRARRRLLQAEKMSVVGQTLASVAHELNNPLAAIVGYADLLTGAEVPADTQRVLGRIREQATRTSRIVKNLLNVARRRGPERVRLSLNEVVSAVLDLFQYEARLHGIVLAPDLSPDLPSVLGDRHALQQVLVNLVQNALHALRGAGRGGRVEVSTRADGEWVRLEVRDDGPGVPEAARSRVFEPFFTTKGADEGTGLGLAISRGIAREHGGDLLLEERADGRPGAVFVVRVPRASRTTADTPAAAPIPEGVPARVLVVDDEAAVRDSLVQTLTRLGAQADSVATASDAERLLGGEVPYDAVLLDVRLPGRSGLAMHADLAATAPERAKRIVFMTGDLVNDDVYRAVRATGNALLEKPFTADELRATLSKAVAAAH